VFMVRKSRKTVPLVPVMDEPVKKKPKINEDRVDIDGEEMRWTRNCG